MRRCNLACGYCNEYDKTSDPVALEEMKRRLDRLASFGTAAITISGGEPLLHPQIYEIIAHIRSHGMIAGLISNGYYMTRENIEKLNDAGLEYLQISIDNVTPDKVSQKSLKVLEGRYLPNLSKYAKFHININSVIGGGIKNPEDALTVAKRAVEFGFGSTLGIIHDGSGQLKPLSGKEAEVYQQLRRFGKKKFGWLNQFQDNLAAGRENNWRCRAGARYLYICEDGLVHYCSQQRGYPGIPLATPRRPAGAARPGNARRRCAIARRRARRPGPAGAGASRRVRRRCGAGAAIRTRAGRRRQGRGSTPAPLPWPARLEWQPVRQPGQLPVRATALHCRWQ